jgi:hypothetical protein
LVLPLLTFVLPVPLLELVLIWAETNQVQRQRQIAAIAFILFLDTLLRRQSKTGTYHSNGKKGNISGGFESSLARDAQPQCTGSGKLSLLTAFFCSTVTKRSAA